MTNKTQSMQIKLDAQQTNRLLEWAGRLTTSEVDADCEPSGYTLVVEVGGPFGCSVEARKGGSTLDLGDVEVELRKES